MIVRRALAPFLVLLLPGCVTTQSWFAQSEAAPAISQVAMNWEGRILVTQDSVNGGRPLPGLAGRLYLFGTDMGIPQKGDGIVAVDLYDVSNNQPGVQPKHLERWQFDNTSLD